MHSVLGSSTCARIAQNNISSKPFSEMKLLPSVMVRTMEIPDINIFSNISNEKKMCTVEFITVPVVENPSYKEKKGNNDLTDDEIRDSYVFEEKDVDSKVDITIIAGTRENDSDCLLLLRFHKCKDYSQSFALPFYDYVFKHIIPGKSGYETTRSGGSSGLTSDPTTDNLLLFLKSHTTSTPRRVRAVKIVQSKTKYTVHYITPYSPNGRKAARFSYCPPRRGGSFYVKPHVFLEFPFLHHFALCKIKAALILQHLYLQGHAVIAEESFKQELKHYNTAYAIASTIKNNDAAKKMVILLVYNSFNMHSIVCYNVGYHVDRFHKGMASLENKAVFRVNSLDKPCAVKDERCRGGGKYVGDFHFALLDWGRSARARRTTAIEASIIQPHQRLTQAFLSRYFNQHPDQQEAFNAGVNATLNVQPGTLSHE